MSEVAIHGLLPDLPTVDGNEHRYGVSGDWHGNTRWAVHCIEQFAARDVHNVFQLGDFGIWASKNGHDFLEGVNEVCKEHDVTVYVTLGNHENYNMVKHYAEEKSDKNGLIWVRDYIALFPRVFRFKVGELEFLSLGGAPSIDFKHRVEDVSWWPDEMLTDEQVEEAIAGGRCDVMLTHDAPERGTQVVENILVYNPQGWSEQELAYAKEGRDRMTRAVQEIKPRMLLHGHYHTKGAGNLKYGEETAGVIYSLDCDGVDGNIAIMDTNDLFMLDFL